MERESGTIFFSIDLFLFSANQTPLSWSPACLCSQPTKHHFLQHRLVSAYSHSDTTVFSIDLFCFQAVRHHYLQHRPVLFSDSETPLSSASTCSVFSQLDTTVFSINQFCFQPIRHHCLQHWPVLFSANQTSLSSALTCCFQPTRHHCLQHWPVLFSASQTPLSSALTCSVFSQPDTTVFSIDLFCFQTTDLQAQQPEEWPLSSFLLHPSPHPRHLLQPPPPPVALEVGGQEPASGLPLLDLLSNEDWATLSSVLLMHIC